MTAPWPDKEEALPPDERGCVSLELSPVAIAALAKAEHRDRVRALYVYPYEGVEAELVDALVSLDLPALGRIEIAHFHMRAAEARALAPLVAFPGLRALRFTSCLLDARTMTALADLPLLGKVSDLEFALDHLSPGALKALLASRHAGRWEALVLYRNALGTRGARLIARASKKLGSLRALDVSYAEIDATGVAALARPRALPRLERLNLSGNPIGDEGARILAEAPLFHRLRVLDLRYCGLGSRGVEALSAPGAPVAMERLLLDGNKVGASGIRRLAAATRFVKLEELGLCCGIGDAGAESLARGPLLKTVEKLDLRGNRIGGHGAIALASSPHLTRLRSLSLENNPVSFEGAVALRASLWPAVREAARRVVPELSASWPRGPARAALDAAWDAVAGLTPGDGPGALRALVARGVLPAALAHDERRFFRDEKVVPCKMCWGRPIDAAGDTCVFCFGGKELGETPDLAEPPTVDRAVAFAADAAFIEDLSRLARDLGARLAPFLGGEPVQRVTWYFYRTPCLSRLGARCFEPVLAALAQSLDEPAMTLGGRGWPLWPAHCWKEAAARDPQGIFATHADPFEPYLAILRHGYGADVDAGAVVLMAPRPKPPPRR